MFPKHQNILSIHILSIILTATLFLLIKTEKIEARIKVDGKNNWEVVYSNFKDEDIYVAKAYYTDSLLEIGWDKLAITTNSMFSDELQAEAAGRLEGELTNERIYYHFLNVKDDAEIDDKISEFLEKQESFVFDSIEKDGKKDDPMLYNAYLIKIQYNALMNQYNSVVDSTRKLTKNNFHQMNYVAEIPDLVEKFRVEKYGETDYSKMSEEELFDNFLRRTHCSALFKVNNDLSEIYFGHNTWNTYYSAIRIIKEYNLNYNNRWIRSKNIIFTSYPATMSSLDDFYTTSHGLVVIETTNIFYNDTLYKEVFPESLFTSERVMVSNMISNSSKEWAENFIKYNSGTYNNQFMILDKNKVNLINKTIDYDAFYIVEQIPGFTKINNVTHFLKFGYWSSYNVPYDKEIYQKSKIQELIDKNSSLAINYDYDNCARTKIFRREQNSATSLENFMKLMRYNKYKSDPYSNNNPACSISARWDLNGRCSGAYDCKVGALSEFEDGNIKIHLIAGPTWDEEEEIEPFNWNNAAETCKNHSHYLIPDIYKFDWIEYNSEFSF
jgi:hypothetical protein